MFRRKFLAFLISLAGIVLTWQPAFAHDGKPHEPASWWTAWSFEPAVLLILASTSLLYVRGVQAVAQRTGRGQSRRAWAFGGGTAILAIALISPVDALAEELFWVHMLQHTLLMLAAAPLLVGSYPVPALLSGMPAGARHMLGRGWAKSGFLRQAWRWISQPVTVWIFSTFVLWLWHAPTLYQASVNNGGIHALQHISFTGSALLFWWVVLRTFGAHPEQRGMAILFLFTTALHSGLLGALLTFSTRLWYPVYANRTGAWGIDALSDQQLAGTIMWVPGGTIYLVAALWMMKKMLESMEKNEDEFITKER